MFWLNALYLSHPRGVQLGRNYCIFFKTGNESDKSIKCKQKNSYILWAYDFFFTNILNFPAPLQVFSSNFDVSFEYDTYYNYSMKSLSDYHNYPK